MYDIAIVGAGVTGAMTARELSKYNLKIALLEKCNDVAMGATKANSGIVHAGFDAAEGSLMAKMNVEGCAMMPETCEKLHVPYINNGSLVVAFSDEDLKHIETLYQRGIENGVEKLKILSKEELLEIEPNINPEAVGALLAETAGIISPYQATWAIAENAVENGAKIFLETKVHNITKTDNWIVHTGKGDIETHYLINAAGLFADKISKMAGARNFVIKPRKGEYFLLDNNVGNLCKHTIFQTPDAFGKGVLVTPTVDGNILVGPSAEDTQDKTDTSTSRPFQDLIMDKAEKSIPNIPRRNIINSFAGVRAIP